MFRDGVGSVFKALQDSRPCSHLDPGSVCAFGFVCSKKGLTDSVDYEGGSETIFYLKIKIFHISV